MNIFQRTMLQSYGQGDYAHYIERFEELQANPLGAQQAQINQAIEAIIAEEFGDTLVLFLWRELADDGDTDRAQYQSRLSGAVEDISVIIQALEGVD